MSQAQLKLPGRKSTHCLYRVTGDGQNANWMQIGAAWLHSDGQGFSINCDLIPLHGRIVMRLIRDQPTGEGAL